VGRVFPRHGHGGRPLNEAVSLHPTVHVDQPITLGQLEVAIRASWSAETAHSPGQWSSANPSAGQCWTTAYVVRHFLGGQIAIAEILPHTLPIQRHAWNRLSSGAEVDLTRSQFPANQEFRPCQVDEAAIESVSLAQAQCLLKRVSEMLGVEPEVKDEG
jgi:hypothetical protein